MEERIRTIWWCIDPTTNCIKNRPSICWEAVFVPWCLSLCLWDKWFMESLLWQLQELSGREDSRKFRKVLYRMEKLVSHGIKNSLKEGFLVLIVWSNCIILRILPILPTHLKSSKINPCVPFITFFYTLAKCYLATLNYLKEKTTVCLNLSTFLHCSACNYPFPFPHLTFKVISHRLLNS